MKKKNFILKKQERCAILAYKSPFVNFYILKLTENVKIEIKQFIQGNGNAVFVSITTGNCHRINSV